MAAETKQISYGGWNYFVVMNGSGVITIRYSDGVEVPVQSPLGFKISNVAYGGKDQRIKGLIRNMRSVTCGRTKYNGTNFR